MKPVGDFAPGADINAGHNVEGSQQLCCRD